MNNQTDPGVRHPSTTSILRHFEFEHLPPHLSEVSARCHTLAYAMALNLPDGPELTAGLRKLLEAKDCFVRAALDREPNRVEDDPSLNTKDAALVEFETDVRRALAALNAEVELDRLRVRDAGVPPTRETARKESS